MKGRFDTTRTVWITDHAMRRARQRLKLKRRAILRMVADAWEKGIVVGGHTHCESGVIKRWRNARFVFNPRDESSAGPHLVTVLATTDEDLEAARRSTEAFREMTSRANRLKHRRRVWRKLEEQGARP